MPALFLTVRFHEGRYHGRPDWPPSPARLFQALLAGAARGRALVEADKQALYWLEQQQAPLIAAPCHREGQGFSNYVPNNDLDAEGGDAHAIIEKGEKKGPAISFIRSPKLIKPILFEPHTPLLYLWRLEGSADSTKHAEHICGLAEGLYQLGRGVDMAWAIGEVLNEEDADQRLADHPGAVHRPSGGGEGNALATPMRGSLDSLITRFEHLRFERVLSNRKETLLFRQPPKPRFAQIAYDSPPARLLFDLVGQKAPAPLIETVGLTERIRDAAANTLKEALPSKAALIERCLVGRGAEEADKGCRVRIVPLPSIGHPHVLPVIKRVLVEVPADCPLRADDMAWAFSGLELLEARINQETGEMAEQLALALASDLRMLRHYGLSGASRQRTWRTVTAAVLPAARRRIDPTRLRGAETRGAETKGGKERAAEEHAAIEGVRQALRHVGMRAIVESVRVQREPFSIKGARAEAFKPQGEGASQRFSKHRLWHVEITFNEPQHGPLIIGDGRYLGLGLMAPVPQTEGIFAFHIAEGLAPQAAHQALTRALRRAVMARVAEIIGGDKPLPTYFSGHEPDGKPARSGSHRHLFYVYDAVRARLLVLAPHILERREPDRHERHWLAHLRDGLFGLCDLHAGVAGRLCLEPTFVNVETDPLFAPSPIWDSATAFRVTRHAKLSDPGAAVERNLMGELGRIPAPKPQIEILRLGDCAHGLSGWARIEFAIAVPGPLLLGRDAHFGGGLFCAAGGQE